jgi:hypothetical protein
MRCVHEQFSKFWGICDFSFSFFGMLALGCLFQCETRELLRLKNVSEED